MAGVEGDLREDKLLDNILGDETLQREAGEDTPVVETSDFDPPPPEDAGMEAGGGEGGDTAGDAGPPCDPYDYRRDASYWVGLTELVSVTALPPLYKGAAFTRQERATIDAIRKGKMEIHGQKMVSRDLTPEELELMARFRDYEELVDKIPLEDDEQEAIISPLAEVLEKYDIKTGPEARLLGAVTTIYGLRLAPLLQRLFR